MRRQSIFIILVLLLNLLICNGCGSSDQAAPESATAAQEAVAENSKAAVGEAAVGEAAVGEAAATGEASIPEESSLINEAAEDVIGIFEGLEDNHTAIFSFDGVEKALYFDTPEVQSVLWEAVIGSSYTLSYQYEETQFYRGLIIYKISE